MAAPGKTSRWGSFLSQAVAGVESRLDNILAENENAQGSPAGPTSGPASGPPSSSNTLQQPGLNKPSPVNSRSSSSNRTNDRLQARLAKAMAAKNAQAGVENKAAASTRSSVDAASCGSLEQQPAADFEQGDKNGEPTTSTAAAEPETIVVETTGTTSPIVRSSSAEGSSSVEQPEPESPPIEQAVDPPSKEHNAHAQPIQPQQPEASEQPGGSESTPTATTRKADISDLAREVGEIKIRQQEEVQEYVERIDSLQAKLQYLSKTSADSAKKAASSAPSGSLERKVAEKDERIALLMEEGQKLSSAEQKYRSTIKKLRQQAGDNDKLVEELRKTRDKATSDSETLRSRLNGTEEKERRQEETRKAMAALQREIDSLKRDKAKRDEAMRQQEKELKSKTEQAEGANTEALSKALAAEREKQRGIEDANTALRAEKEALSDKIHQEALEWREKLDRAAKRAQTVESELRAELRAMESKLEAMRTVAEEASSGSGGEAQVKLFRQIETLQTQYASASDNWQGIETSLLAKAGSFEKERDEAHYRESEMRKKARDAANRCRKLEEELQDTRPALTATNQELDACRDELESSRASNKRLETALEELRADIEKIKRSAERDYTADAEPQQWAEDVAGATSKGLGGPDSPLLSVHRTFSSDLIGITGRPRRIPTPGSVPDNPMEGLSLGRRLSGQPPIRQNASSTTGSGPPPAPFSPFQPPSESSRGQMQPDAERESTVDDTGPSSPRNVAQDMISVSTVAAGPSVQLMERMSAAIRRLEAEKVTAKEEMARVCGQRDEARVDMVGLMKNLEGAKSASSRIPQLEEEVTSLNARYQTTLELLGEKTELVEELKADVEDVKAMYRELVERTVK